MLSASGRVAASSQVKWKPKHTARERAGKQPQGKSAQHTEICDIYFAVNNQLVQLLQSINQLLHADVSGLHVHPTRTESCRFYLKLEI